MAKDFRALQQGRLNLDLVATRPAALEQTFEQRLGFDSRVFDLAMMEYRVAGGRFHRLGDRPTASPITLDADKTAIRAREPSRAIPSFSLRAYLLPYAEIRSQQEGRLQRAEDDAVRTIVMGARWREQTLEVEGVKLSLVDIARRIVMRQWKDPRVLYGLYIPANGAPGLPRQAFTGATVWKRLDARAREFVNSERALEIHGDQLHVSALYFWDKWLFGDEKAVLDHLRAFAAPALRSKLTKFDSVTATYLNWRVNSYNSGYDPNQDRRTGS